MNLHFEIFFFFFFQMEGSANGRANGLTTPPPPGFQDVPLSSPLDKGFASTSNNGHLEAATLLKEIFAGECHKLTALGDVVNLTLTVLDKILCKILRLKCWDCYSPNTGAGESAAGGSTTNACEAVFDANNLGAVTVGKENLRELLIAAKKFDTDGFSWFDAVRCIQDFSTAAPNMGLAVDDCRIAGESGMNLQESIASACLTQQVREAGYNIEDTIWEMEKGISQLDSFKFHSTALYYSTWNRRDYRDQTKFNPLLPDAIAVINRVVPTRFMLFYRLRPSKSTGVIYPTAHLQLPVADEETPILDLILNLIKTSDLGKSKAGRDEAWRIGQMRPDDSKIISKAPEFEPKYIGQLKPRMSQTKEEKDDFTRETMVFLLDMVHRSNTHDFRLLSDLIMITRPDAIHGPEDKLVEQFEEFRKPKEISDRIFDYRNRKSVTSLIRWLRCEASYYSQVEERVDQIAELAAENGVSCDHMIQIKGKAYKKFRNLFIKNLEVASEFQKYFNRLTQLVKGTNGLPSYLLFQLEEVKEELEGIRQGKKYEYFEQRGKYALRIKESEPKSWEDNYTVWRSEEEEEEGVLVEKIYVVENLSKVTEVHDVDDLLCQIEEEKTREEEIDNFAILEELVEEIEKEEEEEGRENGMEEMEVEEEEEGEKEDIGESSTPSTVTPDIISDPATATFTAATSDAAPTAKSPTPSAAAEAVLAATTAAILTTTPPSISIAPAAVTDHAASAASTTTSAASTVTSAGITAPTVATAAFGAALIAASIGTPAATVPNHGVVISSPTVSSSIKEKEQKDEIDGTEVRGEVEEIEKRLKDIKFKPVKERTDQNLEFLNMKEKEAQAFSCFEDRMKTFGSWKKDNHMKKEHLAAAGFFYSGKADMVICYMCNVHLHQWEPTDEVFTEHARHSPHCPFVKSLKGQDFINRVVEHYLTDVIDKNDTLLEACQQEQLKIKNSLKELEKKKKEKEEILEKIKENGEVWKFTPETEHEKEKFLNATGDIRPVSGEAFMKSKTTNFPANNQTDRPKERKYAEILIPSKNEKRFKIEMNEWGEIFRIHDSEFFPEGMGVDSATYHTRFTTDCKCDKYHEIGLQYLISEDKNKHTGYILTCLPMVCKHFPSTDEFRKDMYRCAHGTFEYKIQVSEGNYLNFDCSDNSKEENSRGHLHWATTRIIKLAENDSWDSTIFDREHNLHDFDNLTHKITSSPNVLENKAPYDDRIRFTLKVNLNGSVREIRNGKGVVIYDQNIDWKAIVGEVPHMTLNNTYTFGLIMEPRTINFETYTPPRYDLKIYSSWLVKKYDSVTKLWPVRGGLINDIFVRHLPSEKNVTWERWYEIVDEKLIPKPLTVPQTNSHMENEKDAETDGHESVIAHIQAGEKEEIFEMEIECLEDETDLPTLDFEEVERLLSHPDPPSTLPDVLHAVGDAAATGPDANAAHGNGNGNGPAASSEVNRLKEENARLKREKTQFEDRISSLEAEIPRNRHRRSTGNNQAESNAELLKKLASMETQRTASPPRLSYFDPTRMSLKTYVDSLQITVKAYPGVPKDIWVSKITLALSDPYLSSWLIIIQNDANKTKSVKEMLDEFLQATFIEDSSLSSSIFFNRRQRPEEDARTFGNALFTLARSAFDNLAPDELKIRVKEKFLRSLREPVGSKVRQLLPSSYEDAVKYATAAEGELDTARVMDITPVGRREMGKPRYTGKMPSSRNYGNKRFGEDKNKGPKQYENKNKDTKETRRCFKCGRVGHIARNCYARSSIPYPPKNPGKPLNSQAGPPPPKR